MVFGETVKLAREVNEAPRLCLPTEQEVYEGALSTLSKKRGKG